MNSNSFCKLRFLTCDSPAQTAQPVCASDMPRLRPQTPPQRHPEGIATMRELARQNRIRVREKTPISSRLQSVKLPPIFGSSHARGLCPHPPAQRKTTTLVEYGIRADQRKAELSRQISYECYRLDRKEALCIRAQRISQKESAISERELKAENDWAIFKANPKSCLKVQNAPGAKQAAQDANRTQLETEEELEALERKVSELKIECEEMVLTEPEEEEEEEEEMDRVLMMELSKTMMWKYMNSMDEMHEENKLIKCEKDKKEKMKEKAGCSKEEMQNMTLLIEQNQEELKNLNYLGRSGMTENISRKTNVRQLCKKMADVYMESFKRFCSSDFPFEILSEFNDWSLDMLENMQPKTLRKLLNQLLKDYEMCDRLQKNAEWEALQEERRQKRLERALAPPVKIIGKKLMPRSRPPKVIKKEEPVETKNQE